MQKQQWEAQLIQTQSQSAQLRRKSSQIAAVRFGLFSIAAWSFFQVVDGRMGYRFIFILSLAGFCLAMLVHQKNSRLYLEAQARNEVLGQCLSRFDGRWQQLPETGAEFLTDDQPALADLDVLGPRYISSAAWQSCRRERRLWPPILKNRPRLKSSANVRKP